MTKEAQTYNGIKRVYSINDVAKIGQMHSKQQTEPLSYTIHKNKLKCIKDFNVRLKNMKIPEGNIGGKISDISCSSIFF